MGRTLLLATLIMSLAGPGPIPPRAPDLPSQPVGNSPRWSTIPFELNSNFLIVVQVQIANLPNLRFILDTGASYTVIDQQIADKLALPRHPKQITNFDRQIDVEWTQLPNLQLGPLQTGPIGAVVAKLTDYSDYAQGVDGIGLDVLTKTTRLFINYERHTVAWQLDGQTTLTNKPNQLATTELVAPASSRQAPALTYLSIPITIQGAQMHLVLDTGLQGIVLYKDRLQKSLPNLRTQGPSIEMHFGHTQATQIQLPGTQLEGPESVATALLIDAPKTANPPNIDGYLGITTLHPKRLQLDFSAHTLRWQ